MTHFLEIEQLTTHHINQLIEQALFFKYQRKFPTYNQYTTANLFYENSTRTRVSFELAAKHLGMSVINLDVQRSSECKGETVADTVQNLAAMGIQLFVVRHTQERLVHSLAQRFASSNVHMVNAGDGMHAHPSQAMLDLLTIVEKKEDLTSLRVAMVGNIRHSRVANSLQTIFKKMAVKQLKLVAPEVWQPKHVHFGEVTDSLEEGLTDVDVIICLRVQRERIQEMEQFDIQTYRNNYGVNEQSLLFAKPDAIVMHPGPVNRGIEIEDSVADGPQSVILEQVQNGVFMRMAIFDALISGAFIFP